VVGASVPEFGGHTLQVITPVILRSLSVAGLFLVDGRESECTQGVGDGQGGLARCDSWGRKESDTTERLI